MALELNSAPGHLIRRAQQRHQALWAEIVGEELTSIQFATLALLRAEPKLDQRTLAARASIDTSTLADVCRRLEQRGLLLRDRDVRDTRRYVLRLTSEALALLERVAPKVDEVGEALLDGLSARERSTFTGLLSRCAHGSKDPSA